MTFIFLFIFCFRSDHLAGVVSRQTPVQLLGHTCKYPTTFVILDKQDNRQLSASFPSSWCDVINGIFMRNKLKFAGNLGDKTING